MDIVQDRNRAHLHNLLKLTEGAGQVKSAEDCLQGIEAQLSSIPTSSFADGSRKWPCHTKEATLVSAVYIADAGDKVAAETVQNLQKFAEAWGVGDEVQRIMLRIGMHNHLKTAHDNAQTFALNEEYGGKPVQRFPIDTPELVKLSCDRFYADRAKYPWAWRHKTAGVLLAAVNKSNTREWLDEPTISYLEKAAGHALGTTKALWTALAERSHLAKHQTELSKLAEAVEVISEASETGYVQPELVKMACDAFTIFDSNARIKGLVQLPEESLMSSDHTMTKVAAERANYVQLQNGRHLDLRELSQEKLAAVYPALAGKGVDELRDILPTLPADTADVLSEVA